MNDVEKIKQNHVEIDPNATGHLGREEEAKLCLENTTISRTNIWILIISMIFTILFVPLVQFIHENKTAHTEYTHQASAAGKYPSFNILRLLPGIRGESDNSSSEFSNAFLPSVEDIRAYEDNLEDQSVVANWIQPNTQYVLTEVFGAGNEQVYKGRDNWLFYRSDIDYVTGPGFLSNHGRSDINTDPLKAIEDFNRQLKARGIQLIVMPAAPKPAIHPDLISERYASNSDPVQNPSYSEFISKLRSKDILVFDTTDVLINARNRSNKPQYLATDTHWTPEAVEEIAAKLSDFITKETALPTTIPVNYNRLALSVNGIGDTALMLDLPKGTEAQYRSTVVTHKVQHLGNGWKSDKNADILFLGDSFSNIYSVKGMGWGESAGLAEQLSYQLKRPIDKISINAGGSYATREDLKRQLVRNPDRLNGKRVVVYEFAARELSSGNWKVIALPRPKTLAYKPTAPKKLIPVSAAPVTQPQTVPTEEPLLAPNTDVLPKPALQVKPAENPVKPKANPAKPVSDKIVVQATIAAKSESPAPGSVAYADCVIALHLKNISIVSGKIPPKDIVVFVWGMRHNKLTTAASYNVGQRVTLKLTPWDTAESSFGSYNRVELDDDNLLMLDIYWGEETK